MSDLPRYTREQVAEHGRRSEAIWIIYKDFVYDITKYQNEHPGGDVILDEAGKDATSAFDDIGHSGDAKAIMAKLKIGELVEEEKVYDANGKKKRKIVAQTENEDEGRGCLSIITCGLL